MTLELLTFTRNNTINELKPHESDIVISLMTELSNIGHNKLLLQGCYQIDEDYAKTLNVQSLHKALVITSVHNDVSQTKNLVGDVVLFSDDEELHNNMRVGYFNYELTDWLYIDNKNKQYITVSLGHYISNTIEVEINSI